MKKKFLIVDDAYPNRFLLEQILSEHECFFAIDGPQMWEILAKNTPDMIIMDIGLPGEDGLRLAKKLSEDEKYKNIPLIFLTAHSNKKEIITAIELGGYDYLIKPIDETILIERINRALDRSRNDKLKKKFQNKNENPGGNKQ